MPLGLEFYFIVAIVVVFAVVGVLPLWREKWREDREKRIKARDDS